MQIADSFARFYGVLERGIGNSHGELTSFSPSYPSMTLTDPSQETQAPQSMRLKKLPA